MLLMFAELNSAVEVDDIDPSTVEPFTEEEVESNKHTYGMVSQFQPTSQLKGIILPGLALRSLWNHVDSIKASMSLHPAFVSVSKCM